MIKSGEIEHEIEVSLAEAQGATNQGTVSRQAFLAAQSGNQAQGDRLNSLGLHLHDGFVEEVRDDTADGIRTVPVHLKRPAPPPLHGQGNQKTFDSRSSAFRISHKQTAAAPAGDLELSFDELDFPRLGLRCQECV